MTSDKESAELRRLNDYFIRHKSQAQELRNRIEDLWGHCSVIRLHAVNISNLAGPGGFAQLFAMLGFRSPAREQELGGTLDRRAF